MQRLHYFFFFLQILCGTLIKGPKSTFYAIIMFCETEVKKKAVSCSNAGTVSGVVPVQYIAWLSQYTHPRTPIPHIDGLMRKLNKKRGFLRNEKQENTDSVVCCPFNLFLLGCFFMF